MTIDWTGDGVFGTIGKAIREYNADSVNSSIVQRGAVSFVKNYVQYNSAIVLGSTQQTFALILETLIARMVAEAQTVNGNAVDDGGYVFNGSATPVLAGGDFSPTQMLTDDDFIRVECLVAVVGADTWQVVSTRRGQASAQATTGVAYPPTDAQDQLGLSFTIEAPGAGAYAVGDFFYIGPTISDDQAIIQTFFRDGIGRALPFNIAGGETIPDSLATDNSNPGS